MSNARPKRHPTVVHLLDEVATAFPDREALALGAERLSYRDYRSCVAGFAAELAALGDGGAIRGERVAILLPNSLEICIAVHAAHAAGAQVAPLNPLYTGRELAEVLADAAPRLLLYDAARREVAAQLAQLCSANTRSALLWPSQCLRNQLWHDQRVIALVDVVRQLLADVLRFATVALRPTRVVAAENLFLRRQLTMYMGRDVKPRRPDVATRMSLVLLSRLFDWRTSLVAVRPETLIRWHRAGFRLLWPVKSRPGCPTIPVELRQLIRRMARRGPTTAKPPHQIRR